VRRGGSGGYWIAGWWSGREREVSRSEAKEDILVEAIELGCINGFGKDRVGAECPGGVGVIQRRPGGQDDDGETGQGGALADPAEDSGAGNARELPIEDDQAWERELGTVGKFVMAGEIGEGLFATAHREDGEGWLGFGEGVGHEEEVGEIAFDDED
jgi:hypothetical protein